MIKKIYKKNIVELLKGISDENYQRNIWLNELNPDGLVDSFVESVNMLFDDCFIKDYLDEGHVLFNKEITCILKELSDVIDEVDEYRSELEIVNDTRMTIVRTKASIALELILQSDGSESTVEIVD